MSSDPTLARVGNGGVVRVAPRGTALPESIDAEINAAFHDVGIITDNGVAEDQAASTTALKDWGGNTYRTVQTEHGVTQKFTMAESNAHSLELFYGNYTPGLVEVNGLQPPVQALVIDIMDNGELIERRVAPEAQVTDRSTVSAVNGAAMAYEVTMTCYEDPNYAGDLPVPAKVYKHLPTGS